MSIGTETHLVSLISKMFVCLCIKFIENLSLGFFKKDTVIGQIFLSWKQGWRRKLFFFLNVEDVWNALQTKLQVMDQNLVAKADVHSMYTPKLGHSEISVSQSSSFLTRAGKLFRLMGFYCFHSVKPIMNSFSMLRITNNHRVLTKAVSCLIKSQIDPEMDDFTVSITQMRVLKHKEVK